MLNYQRVDFGAMIWSKAQSTMALVHGAEVKGISSGEFSHFEMMNDR